MMKKLLIALSLVLAVSPLSALAESDGSSQEYSDDSSLIVELEAELEYDGDKPIIEFSWDESDDEDFLYYKLMFSHEDRNVKYPHKSALHYSDDAGSTEFTHYPKKDGTHYYRMCVVTSDFRRGCGDAVEFDIDAPEHEKPKRDGIEDDESIDITLEGTLNDDGKAEFSWTEYTEDNFKWYKLVKSQSTDRPVYPSAHTVHVGEDADDTEVTVKVPGGETNYRLCVVTTDNTRGCSNTVTFETDGPTKEDHKLRFKDHNDHWAKNYIEKLVDKGVINADQDDFRPNEDITRAEAIKMIVVGAGIEAEDCDEDIFPDLKRDDWFCKVATAAFGEGIMEGENGFLRPNAPLNRAQAVKLVLVAKGITVADESVDGEFPDVKRGEWFAKYAKKAKKLGIIKGKERNGKSYFDPGAPITRAELAKIIAVAFGE